MELVNYCFIFVLAFLWLVFASVQDVRKREISNWLNFSLIGFALAYKGIYSIVNNEWNLLIFGVLGFVFFYLIGMGMYYSNAFGGGDAKLLMAFGAVLPIESFSELFFVGLGFVVLVLIVGAVYSLIYSLFVIFFNFFRFMVMFKLIMRKAWKLYYLIVPLVVIINFILEGVALFLMNLLLLVLPLLFGYTKAVDYCMVKLVSWKELQEGDWLMSKIKINGRIIAGSLSANDLNILRKAKRNVFIKYGVPFAPAFLISFAVMVFFFLKSGGEILHLLEFLFSVF